MPVADLGSYQLHYETHGDGPPLVLVAGLGGVGSYWAAQIEDFSRHFRVITYDHRGTGGSSRTEMDYSVAQMAVELLALMDHLGIEHADIVGHSTGGAIGQVLAIDNPERVDRLVLYATWTKCDPFMRRIFEIRKLLLSSVGVEAYIKATPLFLFPDWWINQNADALAAADAQTAGFPSTTIALGRCDAVLNFDRSRDLGKIASPTLVVCAEDDFLTPMYFSEQIARAIPGARLVRIERGGHACSQTVPDAFNDEVLAFLLDARATRSLSRSSG